MNCQEVMELMQRQLDGDLHAEEEDELQAHLLHCLDCALMFERLQRLSDELTQLPKVVPPYSLVDAILPQLGEIDRLAEASITEPTAVFGAQSQSTPAGQPPRLPWTRRIGSQFSWKFAGGVVAAGLIIGFFAFNMKHPLLDQADGLLPLKAKTDSSNMAQSAPAAGTSAGAADKKSAMNDTIVTATPATPEEKQDKAKASDALPVSPAQATTDAKLEKPQAMERSATSKGLAQDSAALGKMVPATSEPARMNETAATGSYEKEPEPNPAKTSTPESNLSDKPQEEPKGAAALKSADPASSALRKADPNVGVEPKAGLFSLVVPSVNPPVKSVTGTYEAVIEDKHIVIRDSSTQEIVFESKHVGQQSDEMTILEWSKDDKLSYEVQNGGISKTFVIDMNTKKEISP
ncbi:zf-HC2 domain-containing protein [Paenibacillus sp. SI8]|uniref:zf-HC2 domain-containing protein n=1 Tax=unclassified Paenibacillus TaxID=185978 RepID=UPI00346648F2